MFPENESIGDIVERHDRNDEDELGHRPDDLDLT